MADAEGKGKDILVVTGGLGCAPVVGAIEYIFRRREEYGNLTILHGVKTPHDLAVSRAMGFLATPTKDQDSAHQRRTWENMA